MSDTKTPEVTLKLEGRLEKSLEAGSPIVFEGITTEFRAEPFMITFVVELDRVNHKKSR